jgi:hypothetical protein
VTRASTYRGIAGELKLSQPVHYLPLSRSTSSFKVQRDNLATPVFAHTVHRQPSAIHTYTVCPQSPLGVLKNCVLCSTLCIVERGSNNSREARRVDFAGLRTNDARIVSTHSSPIAHTRSATSLAIMDATSF